VADKDRCAPGAVWLRCAGSRASYCSGPARSIGIQPDEVWCAAGSGVLARGLAQAWPNASRHVVQVGRTLSPNDVAGAAIHKYPKSFKWAIKRIYRQITFAEGSNTRDQISSRRISTFLSQHKMPLKIRAVSRPGLPSDSHQRSLGAAIGGGEWRWAH
jgi:hypothetical protein